MNKRRFLLLECRQGFEKECAAEICDWASAVEVSGYPETRANAGWVRFFATPDDQIDTLLPRIDLGVMIFPRQWCWASEAEGLSRGNRIDGLIAALDGTKVREIFLEAPDTEAGKKLLPLLRQLDRPLRSVLRTRGLLSGEARSSLRAHVFFAESTRAWVGFSEPSRSAAWPMGIPRLRLASAAPSRSTLKLEEALLWFLDENERNLRLAPGLQAVDLGAAPGGWTWQFTRRGMRVTAVDNGPIQPALLDTGLVTHRREDGFGYRPPQPVDWMVCDMVEQPGRVARLAAHWIREGWCRESIFNLKLPMRKRYAEVVRCREIIERHLASGPPYRLRFRHLYHDREEVTGYLRLQDDRPSARQKHRSVL